MLFPTDIKIKKIKTDRLIKSLRNNALMEISVIEPVNTSNVRNVKHELDKIVRNYEVSILILGKI